MKTLCQFYLFFFLWQNFKISCSGHDTKLDKQETTTELFIDDEILEGTKHFNGNISHHKHLTDSDVEKTLVELSLSENDDQPVERAASPSFHPLHRSSFTHSRNLPLYQNSVSAVCAKCSPQINRCQIVAGIFTRPKLPYGYSLVTQIPAGVCNITIFEVKPSKNFFALKHNERYLLNGNWNIESAGTYDISGTKFTYSPTDGKIGEKLVAPGPLQDSIDLMLLYQSQNPGIRYEYRIPLRDDVPHYPPQNSHKFHESKVYSFNNNKYSQMSHAYQGSGASHSRNKWKNNLYPTYREQFVPYGQVHPTSTTPVKYYPIGYNSSNAYHSKISPNDHIRKHKMRHGHTNIIPGPAYTSREKMQSTSNAFTKYRMLHSMQTGKDYDVYRKHRRKSKRRKERFHWVYKGLTECSKSCGGGNQTSIIACERKKKNKVVSNKRCQGLKKPEINVVFCNLNPCPAIWVPGDWSECSATCGTGVQRMEYVCKQEISESLTMSVPKDACLDPDQDPQSRECKMAECPSSVPYWKISDWTLCSTGCGIGHRKRTVECILLAKSTSDLICEQYGLPKPPLQQSCQMANCQNGTWLFSEWHDVCSQKCSSFHASTRDVVCHGRTINSIKETCKQEFKPAETQVCKQSKHCKGQWFSGPWSSCDVLCGKGKQIRTVTCLRQVGNNLKVVPDENCRHEDKPKENKQCHKEPCLPRWYTSAWSQCECETKLKTRLVKCLNENEEDSLLCLQNTKPKETLSCDSQCFSISNSISHNSIEYYNRQLSYNSIEHDKISQEDPLNEYENISNEILLEEEHNENTLPRKDDPKIADKYDDHIKKSCMDRIKNCELVFKARLCRLKYYKTLCCTTCANA